MLNSPPLGCGLDVETREYLWKEKYTIVTLQWRNLANITLTKGSRLTSPVINHADIMCPLITWDEKSTFPL